MTKLAYWNQKEYDLAMYKIKQQRQLQLQLDFKTPTGILANTPLSIYKIRRIFEGGSIFTTHILDPREQLILDVDYDESLIDVELASPDIAKTGFTKITYHWYHPSVWVDWLKIQDDPTQYRIVPGKQTNGNQQYRITFGQHLTFHSLYIAFSRLLGVSLTSVNSEHPIEASINQLSRGSLEFTLHFPVFFKKWMQNYQTPFEPGDSYPLEITAIFQSDFPSASSKKTDPPFNPPIYNGEVDHRQGNPYLPLPSTEPESRLVLMASNTIILTPEMLG